MPPTPFTVKNGFRFANDFHVTYHAGPLDIKTAGLCGGMCYAALDYYFSKAPLPSASELPVTGSVLETYIYDRQLQAMENTAMLWVERSINLFGWRTEEFYNWGRQANGGGQLQLLRRMIDAGRPCPIGLVSPNTDLAQNHFVVATGYTAGAVDGPFAKSLRVDVYDPNHPDKPSQLVARNGKLRYVENSGEEWLTYFVDCNYRPKQPNLSNNPCQNSKGRDVSGDDLHGRQLSKQDFRCARCVKTNFRGATAMQTDFGNANLTRANFYGANLRNSNLGGTTAERASFYGADVQSATLSGARANYVNFHGANLSQATLTKARMDYGDFYGADLGGASLAGGRFRGASFYGADLSNADLSDTDCTGAIFTGANLAGAKTAGAVGIK